jgi:hypothetical protein
MAYECPRCGGAVSRGSSTTAGMMGGLVGMLIFAAFASFQCERCGPIPTSEFPSSVRTEMVTGTLAMLAGAALLLVGVIYLIYYVL